MFFHGDLHLLIKWIPLSFLCWLLSFLFYHHMWYVQSNFNYLNDLIQVNPISDMEIYKNQLETLNNNIKNGHKKLSLLPFEFKLTLEGYNKGYREDLDFEKLIPLWFELRMLTNFYISYKKYTSILSLIIFSISFLCWCCICFSFSNDFTFLSFPWLFGFLKKKPPNVFTYRKFHSTSPAYAKDARRVSEPTMNLLKQNIGLILSWSFNCRRITA